MDASCRPSGWIAVTAAVLAIVCCVNADPAPMACEVCGSDGEVERAFGTERFDPCFAHLRTHRQRRCPPGSRACVTRLQAQGQSRDWEWTKGGKVVSKSCAESAVSGCHNINLDIYCYCTTTNCNVNANLPIRVAPQETTPHDTTDDDDDDQEGSADGGGGRLTTRQPPVTQPPVTTKFKTSGAVGIRLMGSMLWVCVCLRTVIS